MLSNLICQNCQTGVENVKCEVRKSSNLLDFYQNNSFDRVDISQRHCGDVNNCSKLTIDQRSLKCNNAKPELEFKTCNCTAYKAKNEICSKMRSNQKEKIEEISKKHTNQHNCSKYTGTPNERFCVATYRKQNSMKGDVSNISICNKSLQSFIEKLYNKNL